MNIQILQENLLKALTKTGRIIQSKTQLPILQNVLLKTTEGQLQVVCTNTETTESVWVGAKIENNGSLCVSSRLLTDFVSSLPQGTVTMSVKEGKLTVSCNGFKATIPGISESEFPPVPEKREKKKRVNKDEFVSMIGSVLFSASSDEGRPLLTGIKIKKKEGNTAVASTDGYRLTVQEVTSDIGLEEGVIVPARALQEVVKVCQDEKEDEEIEIVKTKDGQLCFTCNDTDIITRLLEGEYPEYEKIIPTSHTTRVEFEKEELLKAVRSAAVFARDSANIVKIDIKKSTVVISSNTPDVGKNNITLSAKTEGEGGEMAFNSRFLIEFLQHFKEDDVIFEMTGSLNPGVFKKKNKNSYLHIIMPVRVQT